MKGSAFIKRAEGEGSATDSRSYVDIYDNYGVSFVKGSYLTLIKKSAAKDYVVNNSRLEDGVQIVASSDYAKYNSRSFSVTILLEASSREQFVSRIENFTEKIARGAFYLKVPSVKRVFLLVYNDMEIKQEFRKYKATFTLKLTEPNPTDRTVLT